MNRHVMIYNTVEFKDNDNVQFELLGSMRTGRLFYDEQEREWFIDCGIHGLFSLIDDPVRLMQIKTEKER